MHEPEDEHNLSDIESGGEEDFAQRLREAHDESILRSLTPPLLVTPKQWARVSRWFRNGAPAAFLQLLVLYWSWHPDLPYGDYDMLEFFAGVRAMTMGFEFFGYTSYGFEILQDRLLEDILSINGFIVACTMLFRLNPVAFAMFAPVCASWTFLARSKTGRTLAFPLGNQEHYSVRASNVMVSRVCLQLAYRHNRILFVGRVSCGFQNRLLSHRGGALGAIRGWHRGLCRTWGCIISQQGCAVMPVPVSSRDCMGFGTTPEFSPFLASKVSMASQTSPSLYILFQYAMPGFDDSQANHVSINLAVSHISCSRLNNLTGFYAHRLYSNVPWIHKLSEYFYSLMPALTVGAETTSKPAPFFAS